MLQIRRLLLALGVTLMLAGCSGSILTPDFEAPTTLQDSDATSRSTGFAGSGG
jgi:hypothetical protein